MMTNLILQVGLILYGGIVCSYISWISVKKSVKEEVLTLGGGVPGEVVVTYVCPSQSFTLTGAISRIPTHSFPLSRLNVFWPRQTFALRANSGVLCPRAESEADFYSPPVTPGQRVPPP